MADASDNWLVLVMKERHSNDSSRETLKRSLVSGFSLREKDVYYAPSDFGFALDGYLFVRDWTEDGSSLRQILDRHGELLEPYPAHMRVSGEEFEHMVEGIRDRMEAQSSVKHGDIVLVKSGTYSKLYGIVLRNCRSAKVDVGLKFCFGTVTESFLPQELKVVGNIFNYLKVLK